MTVRLYHGGGSRKAAMAFAAETGRLIHPPFGYDLPDDKNKRKTIKYLSADDAREIVTLCLSTPVGSKVGVLVIGPMDRSAPKSADVLLKTVEDYDSERVVPILWAFDVEGVRPTIRSRCHPLFVAGDETSPDLSPQMVSDAQRAVHAALMVPCRTWEVIVALQPYKGKENELLAAMVAAIPLGSTTGLKMWERLRKVAMLYNPSWIELLAATLNAPRTGSL